MLGNMGIAVEFVGVVIAVFGLFNAHSRANTGVDIGRRFRQWLMAFRQWVQVNVLRQPPRDHRRVEPTGGSLGAVMASPTAALGNVFRLDRDLKVEEQLEQLADKVRELDAKFPTLRKELLTLLSQRIEEIRTALSEGDERVLDRVKAEIEALGDHLDMVQVIDLKWAIRGLGVTAIGLLLNLAYGMFGDFWL